MAEDNTNQSSNVTEQITGWNEFIKLIDDRAATLDKKIPYVRAYTGVCTAVNSDGTINVKLTGSTVSLTNFPNRSNQDVQVNQGVVILALDNDLTNAFVLTTFGSATPHIGYVGAYLDPAQGLVCNSSNGLIKANSSVGFATYNSGGTQTGGLDTDGSLFTSKIKNALNSTTYGIIGHDDLYGDGVFLYTSYGNLFMFPTGIQFGSLGIVSPNGISTNQRIDFGSTSTGLYITIDPNTNQIHIGGQCNFENSIHTNGSVSIAGSMTAATKSCIQETKDYGTRLFYCYETSDYCLGDHGRGGIINGECKILIDPIYSQSVRLDMDYDVYLTKYGQGDIWVDEMTPTYFTVKGENIKFAWEIKAKRMGFEDKRLDVFNP